MTATLTYDKAKFLKEIQKMTVELQAGLAIGLNAAMEQVTGEIKSKKLGPKVWERKYKNRRPPKPQVLWMRSSDLQKTFDYALAARHGKSRDASVLNLPSGSIAIAQFTTAAASKRGFAYGVHHEEGKYPFTRPTADKYFSSAKYRQNMEYDLKMHLIKKGVI